MIVLNVIFKTLTLFYILVSVIFFKLIEIIIVIFGKCCIFIINRELFFINFFRHINFIFVFISFFDVLLTLIQLFFRIKRIFVFNEGLKQLFCWKQNTLNKSILLLWIKILSILINWILKLIQDLVLRLQRIL